MKASAVPRFGNLYCRSLLSDMLISQGWEVEPSVLTPSSVGAVDFIFPDTELEKVYTYANDRGYSVILR